jgi:predicted amidophosphoribosyltransferase
MGVFEGGGYMAKGIFRPVMDCRMKTNQAKGFCPVCQRAIEKMIGYYCK